MEVATDGTLTFSALPVTLSSQPAMAILGTLL